MEQCQKDVENLTLLNKTPFRRRFGIVSTSFRRVEESPQYTFSAPPCWFCLLSSPSSYIFQHTLRYWFYMIEPWLWPRKISAHIYMSMYRLKKKCHSVHTQFANTGDLFCWKKSGKVGLQNVGQLFWYSDWGPRVKPIRDLVFYWLAHD